MKYLHRLLTFLYIVLGKHAHLFRELAKKKKKLCVWKNILSRQVGRMKTRDGSRTRDWVDWASLKKGNQILIELTYLSDMVISWLLWEMGIDEACFLSDLSLSIVRLFSFSLLLRSGYTSGKKLIVLTFIYTASKEEEKKIEIKSPVLNKT